MIQKRGHAEDNEDDRVSSSKRSRASISPGPSSSGGLEGKSGLRSLSEGGDHVIENENDNDNAEEEDDYTSSSGSSSSSSSSSSDEDDDNDPEEEADENKNEDSEAIPYIPGRPKPQISLPHNPSDLLSRISSFLPQLQAANADIEQRLAKGESLEDLILDDVKDAETEDGEGGGQFIEMNLGLGVLKEKKKKRGPGDISLGDEDTSDSDEDQDEGISKEDTNEDGEGQVLSQLMGLKSRSGQKSKTKPGIQEVDEG